MMLTHGAAPSDEPQAALDTPSPAKDSPQADRGEPKLWQTQLANGVTVELVGVSEHPSRPASWWRPDGSPLPEAPYDAFYGNANPRPEQQAREFALRVRGLTEGSSERWDVRPGGSMTSSSVEKNGKHLSDIMAIAIVLPKDERTCTVRYGVAGGLVKPPVRATPSLTPPGPFQAGDGWTTEARSRGNSSIGGSKLSIVFGTPRPIKDGTAISISYTAIADAVRAVAEDTSGKVHRPGRVRGGSAGETLRQMDAEFRVKAEQIREFLLQSCPYQWAEFSGVQLLPKRGP